MVRLYNPRRQRWRDHFAWSSDFSVIIGLTATGRATVEALRLNREELVNLRRMLYTMGEHPPEERDQVDAGNRSLTFVETMDRPVGLQPVHAGLDLNQILQPV